MLPSELICRNILIYSKGTINMEIGIEYMHVYNKDKSDDDEDDEEDAARKRKSLNSSRIAAIAIKLSHSNKNEQKKRTGRNLHGATIKSLSVNMNAGFFYKSDWASRTKMQPSTFYFSI